MPGLLFLSPEARRREESRRGTHQCVRHITGRISDAHREEQAQLPALLPADISTISKNFTASIGLLM